ncbi:MAG: methyltransferase [Acidimicrobiales bacterium]
MSRVYLGDDFVYRTYSDLGDQDRKAVWPYITEASADGLLIDTEQCTDTAEFPEAAALVRHPRLPFISYPYEWSFGMLRDAALHQLDVVHSAAKAGVGVKDATPYNIQFVGSTPIFIDIGSFQLRKDSDPWFGYQQFCEMFLYPLMVQAYAGLSFQPLLRGNVNGIPVDQAKGILGPIRPRFQKGRLTHVLLHSLAQRGMADTDTNVAADVAEAGMTTELMLKTVEKLQTLVSGLDLGREKSVWSDYSDRTHYNDASLDEKRDFVSAALRGRESLEQVIDIGCNDGMFSYLAAETANQVVAMDADELVLDRLYMRLRQDPSAEAAKITPLVVDLSTAGGGVGWRGQERPGLFDRIKPDSVLYLAVIHHLALTFNIPIEEQVRLLADITPHLIIEFPGENDIRVKQLLRNKRPGIHDDFTTENFERVLAESFTITRRVEISGGTRTMYEAVR